MASPDEVFGRFLAKQQAKDQFSENINHVLHGRGGTTRAASENRTRSPGLKAGAALALGAPSSAAEAYAEAQAGRRRAAAIANVSRCPFDDHAAFPEGHQSYTTSALGSGGAGLGAKSEAYRDSKVSALRNRAAGTSVGASAPWDAPEQPNYTSVAAAMAADDSSRSQAFADARAAANRNKNRMGAGSDSIIAGNYLLGDTAPAGAATVPGGKRRQGSLPPRPQDGGAERLLPAAQLKLNYEGGSLSSLTKEQAAYLNASVAAEANKNRHQTRVMLG